MQLSKNPKTIYFISIEFSKSSLNFEHFDQNHLPHSLYISEVIDSEKRGYLNASDVPFLKPLPQSTC